MRARAVSYLAAGILAIATGAQAQEHPNLTGTWAAQPGAVPQQVFGLQFTITHDDPALTVTRTINGSLATIKYILDGSEATTRMPGRLCEPDSGAVWKSTWSGDAVTLAMLSAIPPNGKPVKTELTQTLKLEAPDTLRVEVTSRAGGQAAPRTASSVYRRIKPAATPSVAAVPRAQARLAQVSWISGEWSGTMGTSTIEERWTPGAGGSMLAISRTLRDDTMAAFEFLCIVERDGGLVYQAMPNGRSPATDFTLTKIEAQSATFENPAHDYPKMIRYTKRPDGTLEAVISAEGGERAQTYVFSRRN